MYLHLGSDTAINSKNIIGIFDLDNSTKTKYTRDLLKKYQQENKVINVSLELPKSFILAKKNNEEIIYISQISVYTLVKRLKNAY